MLHVNSTHVPTILTVPHVTACSQETASVSPSASVSFVNTCIKLVHSSAILPASFTATGASLVHVTLIVPVARFDDAVPSRA